MKAIEYKIEAITNLHVGNGEVNFGVVDKLIQKDAATGYPVINASSLKGAFREHLEQQSVNENLLCDIFGSKPNDADKRDAGKFRFFDANLLSMPVRGDKVPFVMATCPRLVNDYINKRKLFKRPLENEVVKRWCEILQKTKKGTPMVFEKDLKDIKRTPPIAVTPCTPMVFEKDLEGMLIEDFKEATIMEGKLDTNDFCQLIGSPAVLFSDEDFCTLCNDDHLPVIARNNLTEGHENLWYEQVLPRFSRLYFYVLAPEELCGQFHESITSGLVQIGANATVGYGYCELTQQV